MKKVLTLVLALAMVLGMSAVAFAATLKIDTEQLPDPILGTPMIDGVAFVDGQNLYADDTIIIPFAGSGTDTNLVYNNEDNDPVPFNRLTTSLLSSSKITVRRSATKGSDLIDSVGFVKDNSTVVVEIQLIEEFVSIKEKDLDMKVVINVNGRKQEEVGIYGTMSFETIEVLSGDDYVNLSDGQVAEAQDYVRGVEVELGENVTMKVNMFSNRSYYGTANQKITSNDDAVISQYPSIETVYYLNTINLSGGGSTVSFDLDETYYAYNADGVFVGTTNEALPYSSKYYLSNERIVMSSESSVAEVSEESEGTTTPDPEAPEMGGDDLDAVDNVNDNPGTGVNGFVNVAMVAGVVALAAAGAVAFKK